MVAASYETAQRQLVKMPWSHFVFKLISLDKYYVHMRKNRSSAFSFLGALVLLHPRLCASLRWIHCRMRTATGEPYRCACEAHVTEWIYVPIFACNTRVQLAICDSMRAQGAVKTGLAQICRNTGNSTRLTRFDSTNRGRHGPFFPGCWKGRGFARLCGSRGSRFVGRAVRVEPLPFCARQLRAEQHCQQQRICIGHAYRKVNGALENSAPASGGRGRGGCQ